MRPRRAASATALAVVLLALLAVVPAGADTKSELEAAKKRLGQLKNEIEEAQGQVASLQAQADAISGQIAQTEFAIQETEAAIEETLVGIRRRESRIGLLRTRLSLRARDAYIKGPGGIFEVIFGSSSFGDLSDRLALYDAVQQSDSDLAAAVEVERVELEGRKSDLDAMKARLEEERRRQEAQLAAQQEKLAQMQAVMQRLSAKRTEAAGLVKTLQEKYAKELEAIRLARELAQSGGGPVFSGGSGPFQVCPVGDPNSFSNDFGAPRSGGRTHQGNDIFAPYGTPIYATFDGVVSNASNSLGGLSVYVHGAGGYTYNAHLSRFGQMGSVKAGTVIGYVGNSGNARYTPPHNHFEWHPGGGSAVNPYYYLLEACR